MDLRSFDNLTIAHFSPLDSLYPPVRFLSFCQLLFAMSYFLSIPKVHGDHLFKLLGSDSDQDSITALKLSE